MRRLVLLLLSLVAMTAVAQSKYPINEDFKSACRMTLSLSRAVLGSGNLFLGIMPKGMRSDEVLAIEKHYITSSFDYAQIGLWVITPQRRSEDLLPAQLFLHGGGFVFKGAPYHYDLAKEYACRTGSVVVMLDYRMAYNNEIGVPLQDCMDCWTWIANNSTKLGIDISKIAVVGDSAGGFLAIKTALWTAETGIVTPERMMLIYPVVDCSMRTESMAQYTDTPVWNSVLNREMWGYYLQGTVESSLLDLSMDILRRLPKTYIETSQFDCLRDEGEQFARLLQEAGVETTYCQTDGTMHGFDMVQRSPITKRQITERCNWLNNNK